MAVIAEEENWDDGVYQLETTDPVQGGVDGIDNIPHKALANRTSWLKAQVALKALLSGSATQLFKAKAGVASDDVVNKAQMESALSGIDLSVKADVNHNHDLVYAKLSGSATQLFKVKAGVDSDEAVNKLQLDNAIANAGDLSTNGYMKLNNGLIFQWGEFQSAGSNTTITFPLAFPSKVVSLQIHLTRDNTSSSTVRHIRTKSNTNFKMYSFSIDNSDIFNYTAIGY